ncbi:hypothetical protein K1719_006540 [Acacia pycnantha]|nr:hypothetical protein K1719_006540 [Acacia pycnantha]
MRDVAFSSREEAAKCLQRILRRRVMISSARQAVVGLLTSGGINASRKTGSAVVFMEIYSLLDGTWIEFYA